MSDQAPRFLNIRIKLTNDAFVNNLSEEIKKVLDPIPDLIERGFVAGKLRDSNGNGVGGFNLKL